MTDNVETIKLITNLCSEVDIDTLLDWNKNEQPSFIHIAVEKNMPEIVDLLINKLDSLKDKHYKEETPLHVAIEKEHVDVIKVLLNHHAGIYCREHSQKEAPYALAIKSSNQEIKCLFEEHAAFLRKKDEPFSEKTSKCNVM